MDEHEDLGGADWESFADRPKQPTQKEVERIKRRRRMDPTSVPMHVTMLETRPAAEHLTNDPDKCAPGDLFGPLWRTGEVAILFGETAAGKSILATQIAEAIASGGRCLPAAYCVDEDDDDSPIIRTAGPQKVLYFDFELTPAQFTERYTCPATKQRYSFSPDHLRSVIDEDIGPIPEAFRGDLTKFLLHSVTSAVDETEARVVIIDNLAYLTKTAGRGNSGVALIKNLRLFARNTGTSVLILANSIRRPPDRPIRLDDLAGSSTFAHLADSVFALGRSPLDDSIRYIKHLKSRTTRLEYDAAKTIVCTLTRNADTPVRTGESDRPLFPNPPVLGEADAASADGVVTDCETNEGNCLIPQSALHTPQSPGFLALQYQALYPESELLIDPNTRAQTALTPNQALRRHRIARNRELHDFLLSKDYARHIKGELT